MRSWNLPPMSLQTGCPDALPRMSQIAISMPLNTPIIETSGRWVKPAEYTRRNRVSTSCGSSPAMKRSNVSSTIRHAMSPEKGMP